MKQHGRCGYEMVNSVQYQAWTTQIVIWTHHCLYRPKCDPWLIRIQFLILAQGCSYSSGTIVENILTIFKTPCNSRPHAATQKCEYAYVDGASWGFCRTREQSKVWVARLVYQIRHPLLYIYQASLYMSAQFEGKHSNKMIRQGPTEAQFTEKMFSLYIT